MADAPFAPGSRVGRFTIVQELGHGGTGLVLLARDEQLNRQVALKVLASDLLDDEAAQARFEREAAVTARLSHPNLARVFERGREGDRPFLVMEYIEGQTLQSRLRHEGTPDIDEALTILAQVARALDHIHAHQVVHRDVKPANIMITPEGQAILVDFGLAHLASYPTVTATEALVGTPRYMAPEQIQVTRVDGRADLYSLALVFYEMLAGRPAFPQPTTSAVLSSQLYDTPDPPSEANPRLGTRFDKVMAKALEKAPEKRYPTGEALLAALASARRRPALGWALARVVLFLAIAALAIQPLISNGDSPGLTAGVTRSDATPLWRAPITKLVGLTRADQEGLVVVEAGGRVRLLETESGNQLWQQTLAFAPSGPALLTAHPERLICSGPGGVAALDPKTGELVWALSDSALLGVTLGAHESLIVTRESGLSSIELAGGQNEWTHDLAGLTLPIQTCGELLICPTETRIVALDATDRVQVWAQSLEAPIALAVDPGAARLAVALKSQEVRMLDTHDGHITWSLQAPGPVVGMSIQGDLLGVSCASGQLLGVELATGKLRWLVRVGRRLAWAPLLTGELAVIGPPGGQMHFLDRVSGLERSPYRDPIPGGEAVVPVLTEHHLYVADGQFVTAYPR